MSTVKKNQIFVYLYALTIIMLIDDHCSTRIGLLSNIFPYNSFYMPLFVFISGYFFKQTKILDFIEHKIKRLLIPYIIYDCIMILLSIVIDSIFKTHWYKGISIKQIGKTLIFGPTTSLNGAAWFVIMLFWVSIIYCVIRRIFPSNHINDVFVFIITTVCSIVCLYIRITIDYKSFWFIICSRTAFYLQFYNWGYMFKIYFEKRLIIHRKLLVCSLCMLINIILILLYGDKINFSSTSVMGSFNYVFIPFITSATGILFYYEIANFLSSKFGEVHFISFIGRNTFVIMQVHLLFVNIPNFYAYLQAKAGNPKYIDFPIDKFIQSTWIRFNPNTRLVGFFCGLIGGLLIAYILEYIKQYTKSKMHKNIDN